MDKKVMVRCVVNADYYSLTKGKLYEVVEFIPQYAHDNYVFPRYVTVIDDFGGKSTGHAYRFCMEDGKSCEDYIRENIPDVRCRGT